MGHGNVEYIISDLVAHKLCRKNPQHPRIKRSLATIHTVSKIRQRLHRVAGVPLSVFKSPPFIAELVRHYNSTFLSGKSDLKLDRHNLWRIFFRREYGRELHFLPQVLSVSHKAIYIQKRYIQSDAPVVGQQKRKKGSLQVSHWFRLCQNKEGNNNQPDWKSPSSISLPESSLKLPRIHGHIRHSKHTCYLQLCKDWTYSIISSFHWVQWCF